MARFGFCGSSYSPQSSNEDAQRSVNFYPETDETGWGKSAVALYGTPGCSLFVGLPAGPLRGLITIAAATTGVQRTFAIAGTGFYEIFQNGTFTQRNPNGPNMPGTTVASMAASASQVLIVDGLQAFCFNLATNAFQGLQTYTPGLGAIGGNVGIDQAGTLYSVGDTVSPSGVNGTGAVLTVASATAITTQDVGRETGLVLSNYSGTNQAPLPITAGTLKASGTEFTIAANGLTAIAPYGPSGAPLTSYLYYSAKNGFYYVASNSPNDPGDCYVGAVSATGNQGGSAGIISGCLLGGDGHFLTRPNPQITAGQLEAEGSVFNIGARGLPQLQIAPTGSTTTVYVYFGSGSGFYYSTFLKSDAERGGDCYLGSVSQTTELDHSYTLSTDGAPTGVSGGTGYSATVLSQPAFGTSSIKTGGGAVESLTITTPGTGYAPAMNVATTTSGAGIGLQIEYATTGVSSGSGMIDNPVLCAFIDGYFIVLQQNSQKIQVSRLEDASTWDPTQFSVVSVFVDNIVSMLAAYRQLWLWGSRQTQVYYDSGNIFPFDVVEGGFIEKGSGAMLAPVRLDNSVFWIDEDERGGRMAWRANGYTPQRVSDFGVEWRWNQYETISDAIGYAWQWAGHSFWHIYFPTAGETWQFDAATGRWHELTSWDVVTQRFGAHLAQVHVFAWGKHLIGDRTNGNVYEVSSTAYDDNGNPIQRVRVSPYIYREHHLIRHKKLEIDLEVGNAPQPPLLDGNGNPRDPQIWLTWSDDGGMTWANGRIIDCGLAGQTKTRVIARMLGESRGRCYKLVATDPIAWRIADALLEAGPGWPAMERISTQYGKMG